MNRQKTVDLDPLGDLWKIHDRTLGAGTRSFIFVFDHDEKKKLFKIKTLPNFV